jgi:hypothetical protein
MVAGEHVDAANAHPASVVLTAMQSVGHQGGLGEIAAGLPQLLA